jgi:GntR family transcriptional regulator
LEWLSTNWIAGFMTATAGVMIVQNETTWRLDAGGTLPLHQQLEQAIKAALLRREWLPGGRLPSEREWMQRAGVSRATVRQAIHSLEQQGILERRGGSGTYVALPKLEQPIFTAYSFAEQIRQQGLTLTDTILRREVRPAAEQAADFNCSAGEPLVLLERLRFLEGQTLMVNTSYVPLQYAPGLLTDDLGGSLYRYLTERYGLTLDRSVDVVEAGVADAAQAARLHIPRGAAVFRLRRLGYTHGDVLLHLGENIVRADRCRFRLELPQQPARLEVK